MDANVRFGGSCDEGRATRVERALEGLEGVTGACVVSEGPPHPVVVVSLDPGDAPSGVQALGILDRVAAAAWSEGSGGRPRVVAVGEGWLPARTAFPPSVRRRCVKARYASVLAASA